MSQQKARTKKAKAEAAKADQFINQAKETIVTTSTKTKAPKGKAWPCTAEDIVRERDANGLSWRQVAINLELGSPGQARKAYTELTGTDHQDSQPIVKRAPKGSVGIGRRKVARPDWNDDSDQAEIEERLTNRRITVQRGLVPGSVHTEEIRCVRVTEFSFGPNGDLPLQVYFHSDNGSARCVRVADIIEVR